MSIFSELELGWPAVYMFNQMLYLEDLLQTVLKASFGIFPNRPVGADQQRQLISRLVSLLGKVSLNGVNGDKKRLLQVFNLERVLLAVLLLQTLPTFYYSVLQ